MPRVPGTTNYLDHAAQRKTKREQHEADEAIRKKFRDSVIACLRGLGFEVENPSEAPASKDDRISLEGELVPIADFLAELQERNLFPVPPLPTGGA